MPGAVGEMPGESTYLEVSSDDVLQGKPLLSLIRCANCIRLSTFHLLSSPSVLSLRCYIWTLTVRAELYYLIRRFSRYLPADQVSPGFMDVRLPELCVA
jgi:hypothetical protein